MNDLKLGEKDFDLFSTLEGVEYINIIKEFDPGSGRTLAARLTHASRTSGVPSGTKLVADG